MRVNRLFAFSVAAVVVFSWLSVSKAAPIPWAMPSGSTSNFTYDHGNTDNELFVPPGTSPTATPGGFIFTPAGFKASSANGVAAITTDTVRFALHVKSGSELTAFEVDEFGDYTILGTGPHTAVKAFGSLFITNLDTGEVKFDSLDTNPVALSGASGVTSGQGDWTGDETIVGIPSGWKNIQVVLDNILQANSDPGTSAFIEKKVVSPGVEIDFILPEPGSIGILAFGSILLARRKRLQAA
jgi:hypothetical protein